MPQSPPTLGAQGKGRRQGRVSPATANIPGTPDYGDDANSFERVVFI